MRTFIAAKIHGIRVTDKSVDYFGSISVCPNLLQAAGISLYEHVHVVNLANGARWVTYVLPAAPGEFTLNGGGAFLGEVGDHCVLMTYRQEEIFSGANVVHCNPDNSIREIQRYENP